jgi:hypothetical protein
MWIALALSFIVPGIVFSIYYLRPVRWWTQSMTRCMPLMCMTVPM